MWGKPGALWGTFHPLSLAGLRDVGSAQTPTAGSIIRTVEPWEGLGDQSTAHLQSPGQGWESEPCSPAEPWAGLGSQHCSSLSKRPGLCFWVPLTFGVVSDFGQSPSHLMRSRCLSWVFLARGRWEWGQWSIDSIPSVGLQPYHTNMFKHHINLLFDHL